MTGDPGGVPAPSCAICGIAIRLPWPCLQAHADHCHDCYRISLAGNPIDSRAHRAPTESLVLSPRDVQALTQYQRHVQAVVGTAALAARLTREDEA